MIEYKKYFDIRKFIENGVLNFKKIKIRCPFCNRFAGKFKKISETYICSTCGREGGLTLFTMYDLTNEDDLKEYTEIKKNQQRIRR